MKKLLEDIEKRRIVEGIDPGKTLEKDNLRIHRYYDHVDVTDLTNAGKKDKMVRQFRVMGMGDVPSNNKGDEEFRDKFLDELSGVSDYDKALKYAKSYLSIIDAEDKLEQWELKGIKVPVGKKDLNGAGVSIAFDSTDFMIQNEKDPNLSTIIPTSKEAIKKFFTFMSNEFTQKRISKMSFQEIKRELDKQGIDYRSYLAMD
jgi:hypothetical protein